jgi:serine/threonine kinase PknH
VLYLTDLTGVVLMTVFLSYAHQDAPKIDVLSRDLDDLVGAVWLDKSLSGGQLWWDEILRQIRGCRLFVLAVSRHSLRSEACLAESSYATALDRPFLSVRLDDTDLVAAPAAIRQRQLIEFQVEDVTSIKALARALMHAPQPGPMPAVLPAPPPIPLSYRDRFASLFGPTMTMEEQVGTFARLKLDIDNRANEDEALELLRILHDRPDASWKVREDIDTYLGERSRPRRETTQVPAAAQVDLPRSGWYADPTGRYEMRYWDGTRWTEHVGRGGQQFTDPPGRR